ncbi:hypothetical protein CDV36_016467 [Fusarium kuroshium]|uniref:Uncharacterized protein n=1 Tax=Fusarium kuroshium TaxID=2010991 RepID=A0A3M2QNC7_9HYPO|nr:hypothetical protein CDV36_016467 [Fusarium kuroshium]
MKRPCARANHFWILVLEGAYIVVRLLEVRYLNLTPTQRDLSPPLTTFRLWHPRRISSCSFKSNCRLSCGSKSRFLCGFRSRFLSNIRSFISRSFSRSFSSSSQTPPREPPRHGVPHTHTMAAVPVNRFHALAVPLAALACLQEPKWNNRSSS